jgi:hypothetical protein
MKVFKENLFSLTVFIFLVCVQGAGAAGTPSSVSINLSDTNLTKGETAIVTITFTEPPVNFNVSDIIVQNGTLSNFASIDPLVYQAVFTPTDNLPQTSNTVTVSSKVTIKNYIRPDDYPIAIAFDGTNMWAANYMPDGSILKIAPDGTFTKYDGDGVYHQDIAFDGTNMWTSNPSTGTVTKFSPTGVPTTFTGISGYPMYIASDGTNVWTSNNDDNSVTKITQLGVKTTYTGTGMNPRGIAFDGTNMWTANVSNNSVTKVSPTGVMTTYTGTGNGPIAIAFDGTNMWTANSGDASVTKVSPTGVMTTYAGTDTQPLSIAFDGTNMWTGNYNNHTLTKVSPTGVMTTYSGLSGSPYDLAFDGTNIWSANLGSTPGVSKIGFTSAINSSPYVVNTLNNSTVILLMVAPKAVVDSNGAEVDLDVTINKGTKKTNTRNVTLHFNGDPRYIKGYIVSLDPDFKNEVIRPYLQVDTFSLPKSTGRYVLYFQYVSNTGHKSKIIQKDITYEIKKSPPKKVFKKKSSKR